jgi:Zn-dependent protease with chaperone function
LILLFALAVVAIVIAVNAAAAAIYLGLVTPTALHSAAALPNGFFVVNTILVIGVIGGGTMFKMSALSSGGAAVANLVDAREVDMTTSDLLDRRLVNVVEEMAIASGVPVPRVYVMDSETAINAFAAGHSINDAVITVTRGALTRLSRDELQGVIAHEFSHVLNGDMRLNLRLIGVLHGLLIVALAGRLLLEIGGRSRGGGSSKGGSAVAVLFLAGLALWILGYIGVFFGRLIKAAVSRQREFLADASAVQFTRNPDGIGGALRKIGGLSEATGLGTRIDHPQAETLSHLFLGADYLQRTRRSKSGCSASTGASSSSCLHRRVRWRFRWADCSRPRSPGRVRRFDSFRQTRRRRRHSQPRRPARRCHRSPAWWRRLLPARRR